MGELESVSELEDAYKKIATHVGEDVAFKYIFQIVGRMCMPALVKGNAHIVDVGPDYIHMKIIGGPRDGKELKLPLYSESNPGTFPNGIFYIAKDSEILYESKI